MPMLELKAAVMLAGFALPAMPLATPTDQTPAPAPARAAIPCDSPLAWMVMEHRRLRGQLRRGGDTPVEHVPEESASLASEPRPR